MIFMEKITMKKDYYVMDIDGTIADVSKRLHYITDGRRDWNSFFAEIPNDAPIEPTLGLAKALIAANKNVLFLTARPELYEEMAIEWLNTHGISPDEYLLFSRKRDDLRPDHEVKTEYATKIFPELGINPIMFFDDKINVIKELRKHGFVSMHCADQDANPDFTGNSTLQEIEGKAKLYLMIGAVAAGKSTYIKNNFPDHMVISSDELRLQLHGDLHSDFGNTPEAKIKSTRLWSYIHATLKNRLHHNITTVFDATNLRKADRKEILKCCPSNIDIEYIIIERPLDSKLKDRGWRSEELVRKMHERYETSKKYALKGDDINKIKVTLIKND